MKKQILAAALVFGAAGCASAGLGERPPAPEGAVDVMVRCLWPLATRQLGELPDECAVLFWTNLRPPPEWDPTLPAPPGAAPRPPHIGVCGVGLTDRRPPLPPLPVPWASWATLVDVL